MNLQEIVAAYTSPPAPWTKAKAVKQIVSDRMRRGVARGHGNKAARREAQAFAARMHEECGGGLTPEDIDKMEAYYAAKRPDPLRVASIEQF